MYNSQNKKYDIGETTDIVISSREFIAHINIDKTRICLFRAKRVRGKI
jgi:hypothetical protein